MGPRSPWLNKTSWATRQDDRYSGYIFKKKTYERSNLKKGCEAKRDLPGSMEKFFGRHKFRVSVRRKLESLGSDFLGFLVVRTGRIVVFPRKKCMLLCHFMLLICLPPSKLQFSSQLTRRCASSIERMGDLLPMKMHLVFPHGINVEYVCCFLS